MRKTLLILPLILLLVTNCGIQKRKYQKGYYVNWHKSNTQKDKKEVLAKKEVEKPEVVVITPNDDTEISASVNDSKHPVVPIKKTKRTPLITKEDPCDELIFKDGTELKGKVIEITPTEIKYKKCDMLDGPTYVGKKSDIFMVKYANGTREVFTTEKEAKNKNQKSNSTDGNSKSDETAILALVFGILGFVIGIGSIPAIVLGNNALKKIKNEPDKYEGEELATIGKIFGIVGVVIKLLILFLIIALIAL
jgi:hypothetical protein